MGSRNRSTNASQYRVGRYGAIGEAASRVNSSDEVTSTASAPSAAASGESVSVEKKSPNAATPSMDTVTYPMASTLRPASSDWVSEVPDTDVVPPVGWASNSVVPTT